MSENELHNENGTTANASESLNVQSTENLSKSELKELEKEKTRQEKREWNERRRIKRGKKALRCRKLKNLLFFLTGFVTSIVLLVGGIAVGVKFIPLNTFLGSDDKYVKHDTIGDSSLVDAVMNIGNYKIEDIPAVANLLNDVINGSGLNSLFTVDTDQLNQSQFSGLGEGILNSAKISKSLFGDLQDLEMFKDVKVPADEDPSNPANGITEFEPKLYYYGIEYYGTGEEEGQLKTYGRAFNDDGTRVEGSEGQQLYYLSLSKMSIADMKDVFSERFKLLKIKSVFQTLAGVAEDSFINEVLGDKNIKNLADFDKNDIKIETALGDYEEDKNGKLYKLIWDASHYTEDSITHEVTYDEVPTKPDPDDPMTEIPDYSSLTLADMGDDKFNIDMVRLVNVLGDSSTPEKKKLYKLIWDASRYTDNPLAPYEDVPQVEDPANPGFFIDDFSSLNLKDLSGDKFDINKVRLATVLNSDTGNKVIDKLRTDDTVTLDNIGTKADALTLKEILDVEPMKEVEGVTATYVCDGALYTKNPDGVTYVLVDGAFDVGTKKYSYTGLDTSVKYYAVNDEAGVWFLPLTTLSDSGTPYDDTKSEWGAYGTIVVGNGCTLGELDDLSVNISVVKMKVLKDLGLLSAADPSAAAYNTTLTYLLTLV